MYLQAVFSSVRLFVPLPTSLRRVKVNGGRQATIGRKAVAHLERKIVRVSQLSIGNREFSIFSGPIGCNARADESNTIRLMRDRGRVSEREIMHDEKIKR